MTPEFHQSSETYRLLFAGRFRQQVEAAQQFELARVAGKRVLARLFPNLQHHAIRSAPFGLEAQRQGLKARSSRRCVSQNLDGLEHARCIRPEVEGVLAV